MSAGAPNEPAVTTAPAHSRARVFPRSGWPERPGAQRFPLGTADAPDAVLRRDALFRRLLVAADVGAGALSLAAIALLDGVHEVRPLGLVALPLVVLVAKVLGLYERDELVFHKSTLDEAPKLFQLAILCSVLLWMAHDAFFAGNFERLGFVILLSTLFLGGIGGRGLARLIAGRRAAPERCLIIGRSSARLRFASKLGQADGALEVVGYLPLEDERRHGLPIPGTRERRRRDLRVDHLEELVSQLDVHRAVIIPGNADAETMLDAIGQANAAGVKVTIVPRLFEVVGSSVEVDDLEGLTVLGVRRFGLSRSSRVLKRALDVGGSLLLLILLAPLLALIALAIRISSPGPVFFRQTRVGKYGRHFEMLKFRTMIDGADEQRAALAHLNQAQGMFKIAADPRLTAVGRAIRKISLDELPQLVNVLRGEMSLVGPRPLVLEEDRQVQGWYRRRQRMVPGVTGPWQLLGPIRVPLNEMLTIDYLYGANWSLWRDIKILLRTIVHVLTRRGL